MSLKWWNDSSLEINKEKMPRKSRKRKLNLKVRDLRFFEIENIFLYLQYRRHWCFDPFFRDVCAQIQISASENESRDESETFLNDYFKIIEKPGTVDLAILPSERFKKQMLHFEEIKSRKKVSLEFLVFIFE